MRGRGENKNLISFYHRSQTSVPDGWYNGEFCGNSKITPRQIAGEMTGAASMICDQLIDRYFDFFFHSYGHCNYAFPIFLLLDDFHMTIWIRIFDSFTIVDILQVGVRQVRLNGMQMVQCHRPGMFGNAKWYTIKNILGNAFSYYCMHNTHLHG